MNYPLILLISQTCSEIFDFCFKPSDEVSPDDEAFQQQLLSTEDCETPTMELAECPTASPEPSSSSLTPSSEPSSSSSLTPSPTVPATEDQPATEVPLLYIVIAGGALVILVAGGVFVMVTVLVCRKRNRTSGQSCMSCSTICILIREYGSVHSI